VSGARPLILAAVSGKGGVGKTLLSVSLAREISRSTRTLLVDLDFFNRGLTGLLQEGKPAHAIAKPDFLAPAQLPNEQAWEILDVAPNLLHVSYPDLTESDIRQFESSNVYELKRSLEAFILNSAAICNCDCVVMDCHGGPDNSSFAACLFADHNLLVSEPDRITFYGTLNFLRQLRASVDGESLDIHLVFNKVVPAFSATFLASFYNKHLKEEFGGKPLLAIFPLEVYLTKEFEKTPFLTEVYPTSLLARKTQVLLFDLLARGKKGLLPAVVKTLPSWIRKYRRFTLGKQFVLFDLNFLMFLIVAGFVVYVIAKVLEDPSISERVEELHGAAAASRSFSGIALKYVESAAYVMAVWFPTTLLIAWSKLLDLWFVHSCRTRHRMKALGIYGSGLMLWFVALFTWAGLTTDSQKGNIPAKIVYFTSVVFALVVLNQVVRIYRGFRYDHRPFENVFRLIFVLYVLVMAPVLYKLLL
jgi:cellulose biosynthesis protein BcsQ